MRGLASPLIKLIVFAVVTILATGVLAATIASVGGSGGTKFHAVFSDVTSLNEGDDVRIAGVKVGQVDEIAIVNEREARVTFSVGQRDWLPATSTAALRFRNLVGQRYIALGQGEGDQGLRMTEGDTIPIERTGRPSTSQHCSTGSARCSRR